MAVWQAGDECVPMDCGPIQRAPVFNIRNGHESSAVNIYVRPTIPTAHHWVPIPGLPTERAIDHVGAYVRSAKAQLDEHLPAGTSEVVKSKQALILGVGRAVMTSYYDLSIVDLIPGETADAVYEGFENPPNSGVWGVRIRPNIAPNRMASAQNMPGLTEHERQVAAALHSSMVGALPLQGYSLMMTQHHYLSAHGSPSRRAFDVVERQFWKSVDVSSWFQDDLDMVRDLAWHKTGHPVNLTVKYDVARDPRVAAMVKAAGAGSAAARLPAVEPEIRAAGSYRTLCSTVRPLLATYGGSLDFGVLEDAIAALDAFPYGMLVPNPVLPPSVPMAVTTRQQALNYLTQVMVRNSDLVAYCFGFYVALSEQSMLTGGAAASDTLKASYSLAKLKTQSYASYVAGNQAFGDYDAAKRAARGAGQFSPPALSFF